MNLKCIVIDDEPRAIEIIEGYINQVPFLELLSSFRNPVKAFEFTKQNQVELIFLDINMPNLTGLEFIKTLTQRPLIILTTAYSEYAIESYELDVLDYLLKPIEFHRFFQAVNKALDSRKHVRTQSIEKNINEIIFVQDGYKLVKIELKQVMYIEASGNYQAIYLKDKKILSLIKMDELLKAFKSSKFVRVHKSYAINIEHIESIESHRIKIGNTIIPIGETFRNSFYSSLK